MLGDTKTGRDCPIGKERWYENCYLPDGLAFARAGGTGTLYYHCDSGGDSATVSAAPGQPEGTTYSWTIVSGPLMLEAPTDQSSVTVRATDPPVGICVGRVRCTYAYPPAYPPVTCSSDLDISVRKPYKAVTIQDLYTNYNDEPASKGGNPCVIPTYCKPNCVNIWGYMHAMCYQLLDQCEQPMAIAATATEAWNPPLPGMQTGSAALDENGQFCDCIGATRTMGPITVFDPPVTSNQTLSVWGCLVRTNSWVFGNTDATYTNLGP